MGIWNVTKNGPIFSMVKQKLNGQVSSQKVEACEPGKSKASKPQKEKREAEAAAEAAPPPDLTSPEKAMPGLLEEKLQLEQAIAGVVGGPTGLLMALDVMVYDTEERNPVGFRCHAEGYFWRLEQLQTYLERYQEIAQEEIESMPLYRSLLAEGTRLKEIFAAPEELTNERLDQWREDMLRHIDLYGKKEEDDHEQ